MVRKGYNEYLDLGNDVRVRTAADNSIDKGVARMITLDVKENIEFLPKSIQWALIVGGAVWLAVWLKTMEPELFPVITDFKIENVEQLDNGTAIEGTMLKARGCEFKEVVAYSGNYLVDVQFTETTEIVSRIEGQQAWGVWVIVPKVKELTLYARHKCVTGTVQTKLFEGLLL